MLVGSREEQCTAHSL